MCFRKDYPSQQITNFHTACIIYGKIQHVIGWIRVNNGILFLVCGNSIVQELHVKARLVTIVLDVGDFEAGFGRAVSEIGMRIGGWTEGGTVVIAKSRIVDISISDIIGTVWPENRLGVRYGGVVKKSIAGSI